MKQPDMDDHQPTPADRDESLITALLRKRIRRLFLKNTQEESAEEPPYYAAPSFHFIPSLSSKESPAISVSSDFSHLLQQADQTKASAENPITASQHFLTQIALCPAKGCDYFEYSFLQAGLSPVNLLAAEKSVVPSSVKQPRAIPISSPAEIFIAEILKEEPFFTTTDKEISIDAQKRDELTIPSEEVEIDAQKMTLSIEQMGGKQIVEEPSAIEVAEPEEEPLTEKPLPETQTATEALLIEPAEEKASTNLLPEGVPTPTIAPAMTPANIERTAEGTLVVLTTPGQEVELEKSKTFFSYILAVLLHPSVLMVLSTLLFSTMTLFVKLASDYYNNYEIIAFRGLVGAICIAAFVFVQVGHRGSERLKEKFYATPHQLTLRGRFYLWFSNTLKFVQYGLTGLAKLKTKYLGMQIWRALVGTTSMACWFYGISKLTLALSTTLNYMSSVWMAIFIISAAFFSGRSTPSFKLLFSVLLGFTGIIIVLRPSGLGIDMLAASVVIIGSIFGALAYLQVASLGRLGEPAYRTVFYFSLFGFLFGIVLSLAIYKGFSPFSLRGLIWLIPIGILAMLAQLCMTLAYTRGSALVNASLQYTGLIFVVFFDWVLQLGIPDFLTWVGMFLVVFSGLFATIVRAKKPEPVAEKTDAASTDQPEEKASN